MYRLAASILMSVFIALSGCSDGGNEPSGGGGSGGVGGSGGLGGTGGTGGQIESCGGAGPGPEDPSVSADTFESVSALGYSCGIREDGSLACWGENPCSDEVPPGEFKSLSVGWHQACGITVDDRITCWGCPPGDGGLTPPAGEFTALAMGADHICAIRASDDKIVCAGALEAPETDDTFSAVASAKGTSCGIVRFQSGANIRCWGSDADGRATPPDIHATKLGGGAHHFCAIDGDGKLACWGMNNGGQTEPPNGTFIAVEQTCGLLDSHELACWAGLRSGMPDGCFKQVDAGLTYACAVREDGHVVCWGSNTQGESTPP